MTRRGSLTAGKWADMLVLSTDLFKVPPGEILKAKVLMTMVGGRLVHRDESWR